jgi:hypothetical protein
LLFITKMQNQIKLTTKKLATLPYSFPYVPGYHNHGCVVAKNRKKR